MVYKHAHLNRLLLLQSSFMLRVVKMLLNGEVGGYALNSHGYYIVDHVKSWNCVFEFLWKPCVSFSVHRKSRSDEETSSAEPEQQHHRESRETG